MRQHVESFLAERVLKARQDRAHDADEVARLYDESWKNCFKRIEQLSQVSIRTDNVQAGNLVIGFGGANNSPPTSPGDVLNDAGAGPSSA